MSSRFRSEHEFNRWWTQLLRDRGAMVKAMVASMMQEAGLPDRYVAHARFHGWLEGKISAPLSTAQRLTLKSLNDRGVPAFVMKYAGDLDEVRIVMHDGRHLASESAKEFGLDPMIVLERAMKEWNIFQNVYDAVKVDQRARENW